MNTYLEPEEVHQLTGRKQAAKQCAFLTDRGWCFFRNADGRPQILRTYHDAMLTGQLVTPPVTTEPAYGVFGGR